MRAERKDLGQLRAREAGSGSEPPHPLFEPSAPAIAAFCGIAPACNNNLCALDYRRGGYLKVYRLNRKTANLAAAALICGAVAIPSARARSIPPPAYASRTRVAQADTDPSDDDKDVPPAQVDKYININLAMQKNHGLTVEQAASQQGMTVAQFRSLEGKIERDDTLRERVRTALRKAANPNATDSDQ